MWLALVLVRVSSLSTAPTTTTTKGSVAFWHSKRRGLITELVGPTEVAKWTQATPFKSITTLVAVDVAQALLAVNVDEWSVIPCALTVGAWLSLGQFALLHDVLHGGADVPWLSTMKERREYRSTLLYLLSAPSAFGYWLYLELGHMSHHAFTGESSIEELFDSDQEDFEDGDLFFAAHRQDVEKPPPPNATGPPVSIARSFFGFWRNDRPSWNMALYSLSMLLERTALVFNDKYVAVSGSNSFFFPNKPPSFHLKCAGYARFAAFVQFSLIALNAINHHSTGLPALAYILLAETAWQLPFFPASALYVSNHFLPVASENDQRRLPPVDPDDDPVWWPTHSVYATSPLFDLLCFNANYHLEHHDFPEVSLWRLPELRSTVVDHERRRSLETPSFYPPSPPPTDVISRAFHRPTLYATWARSKAPVVAVETK